MAAIAQTTFESQLQGEVPERILALESVQPERCTVFSGGKHTIRLNEVPVGTSSA